MAAWETEDIDAAIVSVRRAASSHHMLDFPVEWHDGVDPFGDLSVLPTVDWVNDDIGAFLDLGSSVGARILYSSIQTVSGADLTSLDPDDLAQSALRRRLTADIGQARCFTVGWVKDGVLHRFEGRHPAYGELLGYLRSARARDEATTEHSPDARDAWDQRDRLAEIVDEIVADSRVRDAQTYDELKAAIALVARERSDVEAGDVSIWRVTRLLAPTLADRLAPHVAADPRFRRAKWADQVDVVPAIIPEWRHFDTAGFFRQVATRANELTEPELARDAHRLRSQRMTLEAIAGRIGRSSGVVRRLLNQYPEETAEPSGPL